MSRTKKNLREGAVYKREGGSSIQDQMLRLPGLQYNTITLFKEGSPITYYSFLTYGPYIGETGRNLSTRLTEHKRATRNGDVNNHIAEHHLKTKHQIDWDSATCITYSTDYNQRLTLESWFTNLEQTPLNRSQQLPAPYKRLIDEIKQN